MFDKNKPMLLGDLFSVGFNLIKKTFIRNAIIAIVFLIPSGIIMVYGFHTFLTVMVHSIKTLKDNTTGHAAPSQVMNMIGGMLIYYSSFTIYFLAHLGVVIGITKIGTDAMQGERTSLADAFRKIFSVTYLRSLGQVFLLSFVLAGATICAIFMFAIAGIGKMIVLKIMAGVLILGAVIFVVYLWFRWYFAFFSIVCEDKHVIESFSKSSFLVKHNWWRVFGIVLLLGILIQFAISIISTPLSFVFMWNFMSKYSTMALSSGNFTHSNPAAALEMMRSLAVWLGVVMIITGILKALVSPLFKIALYFDLRIRKHEFVDNDLTAESLSFE